MTTISLEIVNRKLEKITSLGLETKESTIKIEQIAARDLLKGKSRFTTEKFR